MVLLDPALLAYSFGLRHAVDADRIAAIDNVTRKLMQEGKHPVAVGFMFSLGHSTAVVLGSAAIAFTALWLQHRLDAVRHVGSIVGTAVSTLFFLELRLPTWLCCARFIRPSNGFAAGSATLTKI